MQQFLSMIVDSRWWLLGLWALAAAASAEAARDLRDFFEGLDAGAAPVVAGRTLENPAQLSGIYRDRAHAPLWIDDGPLAHAGDTLLRAVRDSAAHGLNPQRYHYDALVRMNGRNHTVAFELLASDALVSQVRHRSAGAVSPRDLDPDWHLVAPERDAAEFIDAAIASGAPLRALLDALWPESAEYGRLVSERARLVSLSEAGPHPAGIGPALIPGDLSRIDRIDANLERWRWLPAREPDTYVRVNIAAYTLRVIHRGRDAVRMNVIVGQPYRRTPVFTETIKYMVFNPYWYVPFKLAVQDKLPDLKEDPARLAEQGFEVRPEGEEVFLPVTAVDWSGVHRGNFHYLLRQRPGPANALGRVKFMLPNEHAVYLHDTPTRELFDAPERGFSSGCVRLERPLELAAWLLEHDGQAAEIGRIPGILAGGEPESIHLRNPVPAYLVYFTAFTAGGDDVVFRRDLYERDAALVSALRRETAT